MTTRYGIVGTGLMGLEHMRNIALLPGAEVTAICDPHPRSRKWAEDLHLSLNPTAEPVSFEDHLELARSGLVDAVVIASPNHTHAEVLDGLWGSGLHLLVEKPMCTTLADCRVVEEKAASHDGVVWIGMEYRYMPPVARLIQEVDAGTVGRVRMVAIREHRFPFLPKVGDWNRFNRNTGGTLVEKCCHFFDLMARITGAAPQRVYASGAQDVNHLDERYDGEVPDILDNAFVVVDFDGGIRASLDLCMFAEASLHEQEISVTGDAGKLECLLPDSTVRIGRRDLAMQATDKHGFVGMRPDRVTSETIDIDERLLAAGHHHGATYWQHRAFLMAIAGDGPVEVGVADGTQAVAIGCAAHRSIELGRPVEMSELLEDAAVRSARKRRT